MNYTDLNRTKNCEGMENLIIIVVVTVFSETETECECCSTSGGKSGVGQEESGCALRGGADAV